jgi:hypothetical protein
MEDLTMGIDNIIKLAAALTVAAALTGQLPRITQQIRLAQFQLAQQSRASNWGSPDIFSARSAETGKAFGRRHEKRPRTGKGSSPEENSEASR